MLNVFAVVSNYLLVIVGIAGTWVAVRTLKKIERQTKAAENAVTVGQDTAKAALLNAQAVINAERATLLFTVTKERVYGPPPRTVFKIAVKNFGRVPARGILVAGSQGRFVNSPNDLSQAPAYDFSDQTPKDLVPGESLVVGEFDPEKPSNHIQRAHEGINFDPHLIQAVIFGEVTYKDGISSELRHSRFCFGHDRWPFSNIGGSAVPCGPDVFRECT